MIHRFHGTQNTTPFGDSVEFSQDSFAVRDDTSTLVELGGRSAENTPHMVTETLIRGMYDYWRKVMEL